MFRIIPDESVLDDILKHATPGQELTFFFCLAAALSCNAGSVVRFKGYEHFQVYTEAYFNLNFYFETFPRLAFSDLLLREKRKLLMLALKWLVELSTARLTTKLRPRPLRRACPSAPFPRWLMIWGPTPQLGTWWSQILMITLMKQGRVDLSLSVRQFSLQTTFGIQE